MIFLLRISVFALFLGRAWHCLRWSPPFSNIYYEPKGFGKVLEWWFDTDLFTIFSQRLAEPGLVALTKGMGIVFLLSGIAALLIQQKRKWLKWFLYAGTLGLIFLSYGFFKAKNLNYGMLFEHTAQMVLPLLLTWSVLKYNESRLNLIMKIAIAVTFVCHGLFAVGYYIQPGRFADMMIIGLGMSEETARTALVVLGYLDFVFAIAIFIKPIAKPALIYGIVWGFLTAFARIYINISWDFLGQTFSQYFFEFLVRWSHFMLPLIIYFIETKRINRIPFRSLKKAD